jgi:hypothetical protein
MAQDFFATDPSTPSGPDSSPEPTRAPVLRRSGPHGWIPRGVLAAYGLMLSGAGAILTKEPDWSVAWRAVGTSSVVLGAGCVLLAARPHRSASAAAPAVKEPAVTPPIPADRAEAAAPAAPAELDAEPPVLGQASHEVPHIPEQASHDALHLPEPASHDGPHIPEQASRDEPRTVGQVSHYEPPIAEKASHEEPATVERAWQDGSEAGATESADTSRLAGHLAALDEKSAEVAAELARLERLTAEIAAQRQSLENATAIPISVPSIDSDFDFDFNLGTVAGEPMGSAATLPGARVGDSSLGRVTEQANLPRQVEHQQVGADPAPVADRDAPSS